MIPTSTDVELLDEPPALVQVTIRRYQVATVWVLVKVLFVAAAILVQVLLSGDDCHWYVRPAASVEPVTSRVNGIPRQTGVADVVAVPPRGAPAQAPKLVIFMLSIPISVKPKSPVALNRMIAVADSVLNRVVFVLQKVAQPALSSRVKVVPPLVEISTVKVSVPEVFI